MLRSRTTLCLLFLLATGSLAAAQSAPFSLAIDGPENTIKSGEPITIFVNITNLSDRTLYIPRYSPLIEYDFDILDPSNLVPSETELAYRIKHPGDDGYVSASGGSLKAHGQATYPITLTGYFVMSRPGSYLVRLSRVIPSISPERVTSNVIYISVAE